MYTCIYVNAAAVEPEAIAILTGFKTFELTLEFGPPMEAAGAFKLVQAASSLVSQLVCVYFRSFLPQYFPQQQPNPFLKTQ